MTLSDILKLLGSVAEVAAMFLLVYVVYKISMLLETLNRKIKNESAT